MICLDGEVMTIHILVELFHSITTLQLALLSTDESSFLLATKNGMQSRWASQSCPLSYATKPL